MAGTRPPDPGGTVTACSPRGQHVNRRSGMAIEESGDRGDMRATASGSLRAEYRCADCGYGISTFGQLPACPMCRAHDWAPADWHPSEHALGEV
jgi:rubrerythrin